MYVTPRQGLEMKIWHGQLLLPTFGGRFSDQRTFLLIEMMELEVMRSNR
jgi:hypothetical protein